jgi:hypothetical protein
MSMNVFLFLNRRLCLKAGAKVIILFKLTRISENIFKIIFLLLDFQKIRVAKIKGFI